ncbi:OsmC family protein [Massilia yuzhufengensis]|uniref:Putative redox protein n=1 Tax=Massilia yuzhufengensis TaxID=1164594 RepID=A0A1I1UQH2_9BURK|nr:OsmC family protein [Massilia yuzhufengensis]SFD71043.1 putative redox protein [Massilia yuzhufengensis]
MEVTAHKGSGKLQQVIGIGRHQLLSDAPDALGGEDSGPEPHDLLAAALAACTALTVTMYAKRKGMLLDDVRVRISHGQKDGGYAFQRHIEYVGELGPEDRQRLTDVANKCPVHKTLSGTIRIDTQAM